MGTTWDVQQTYLHAYIHTYMPMSRLNETNIHRLNEYDRMFFAVFLFVALCRTNARMSAHQSTNQKKKQTNHKTFQHKNINAQQSPKAT